VTSWTRYAKTLAATLVGLVIVPYAFVAIVDPYSNVPFSPPMARPMVDINQRYMYPALARSGRFDSAIFGTSTSRLLDPKQLDALFGGKFANLAMNSATAWEQTQLAKLFIRHNKVKMFLVGLDTVWCEPDADVHRLTIRPFPPWMYDEDRWNDLAYLLNGKTVEIAGRLVEYHLGLRKPRIRDDGYEVFTPPESQYDLARARTHIHGNTSHVNEEIPPVRPVAAVRGPRNFPALAWLDDLLGRLPPAASRVLVFMPVHVEAQPGQGTDTAAMEADCKRQLTALALRRNAHLVDFRIPSPITTNDSNYWDRVHFRLGIATRVATEIAEAVRLRRDAVDGDYRYLAGPPTLANRR
jgi:hypothetical protein